MRLAVLKERAAAETRVAATPDTVKKLVALGLTVAIEAGAGVSSAILDADYTAAGAEIVPDAAAALAGAGVVFAVQLPERADPGADPARRPGAVHQQRQRQHRIGCVTGSGRA